MTPNRKFEQTTQPNASLCRKSPDRLCNVCREIDFDLHFRRKLEQDVVLGSWSQIQTNHECPFCRLVTHCLEANPRLIPTHPNTPIQLNNELSWRLGIEISPYDRTHSESYSNKFDLRSKAKSSLVEAYRYMVTAETTEDRQAGAQPPGGLIQYLAHKTDREENKQFYGRKVFPEKVNIDLIRSWLGRCRTWHDDECGKELWHRDHLPRNFRLIDVRSRCIVRASQRNISEYVAMSYVWGKQAMREETGLVPAVLERDNIVVVSGQELTPLPRILPKTIEDAILLTKELGFRYLWNDALCIAQDSTFDERIPHLETMKVIYSRASLTIAVASGTHADHGIPGIGISRAIPQYSELINGLRLATMFPSFSELENSSDLLWNTRGWTLQEKLLSKRLLLFTDYQVYFKCSESIWTEEIIMETERLSRSKEARPGKYRWKPNRRHHVADEDAIALKALNPLLRVEDTWDYLGGFLDFAAAVQEYTKRNLSDPKDTLFAFDGLADTMVDVVGDFVFGMPQKHFLESLLWYPEPGCIHTVNSAVDIPTWSWAGWHFEDKGAIFDLMDIRQLRALMMLLNRMQEQDSMTEDDDSYYSKHNKIVRALARTRLNLLVGLLRPLISSGLAISQIYYSDGLEVKRIQYDDPIQAFRLSPGTSGEREGVPQLFDVAFGLAEKYARAGEEPWTPSIRSLPRRLHAIIFQSVVVRFRIGNPISTGGPHADENTSGVFELMNSYNECVGEVKTTYRRANQSRKSQDFLTISWGMSLESAAVHPSYIPRWRFSSQPTGVTEDESREAAMRVINQSIGLVPLVSEFVNEYKRYMPPSVLATVEPLNTKYLEDGAAALFLQVHSAERDQFRPRSLWPVVNLILVDWDGNIARRAGVAKVIMKAWEEKRDTAREIVFA